MTPHNVEQLDFDWHDAERDRAVPVRIHAPREADSVSPRRRPIVVFSHGLGGTREGYGYLGRSWAARGYVALHVGHAGSDLDALRRAPGRLAQRVEHILADWPALLARPRDAIFALNRLLADQELSRRVDPSRIAIAGHSLGAFTALCCVGLRVSPPLDAGLGSEVSFADARFSRRDRDVASPAGRLGIRPDSWREIHTPVMHLSGGRDSGPDVADPLARRMPFERISGTEQFLVFIDEIEHMGFVDLDGLSPRLIPRDPRHHELILATTGLFLDAFACGDAAAAEELRQLRLGGGAGWRIEHKPA